MDDLVSWVNDIKGYAFQQAMRGKKWSNFKLVEERAMRRYLDEELVATAVANTEFSPYEKKLLGITSMTYAKSRAEK